MSCISKCLNFEDMATRYPFVSTDMSQMSLGQPVPGLRFTTPGSWAQQAPTSRAASGGSDQKHKEYLKQQERLRFMAASARKAPVSADALIENLMGKEETFKPKSHSVAQQAPPLVTPQQFGAGPQWLQPSSAQFPTLYKTVWALVGQPSGLADTSRLSPLLLSSGLPTEVLGFIWGVANQQVLGHLTERETYLVLALVALAQSGCTFNSLNVLNLIPQPPVPSLTLPFAVPESKLPTTISVVSQQPPKLPCDSMSVTPSVVETTAATDDDFDDFADFQSAAVFPQPPPTETSLHDSPVTSCHMPSVSSESKCETPTSQKFPNVVVVGSTGRSVGSRLANHSLGAPKTNRTRHHKHHRHQHQISSMQPPDDEFSEFQQAKTSAIDELFPKCSKKQSHSVAYTLKESAIRVEGDVASNAPELLVFDASPAGSGKAAQEDVTTPVFVTEKESMPAVVESPVLTVKEKPLSTAVTEDRYSALRDLFTSDDKQPLNEHTSDLLETTAADDFGDFHSADDLFADIAKRETVSGLVTKTIQDDALPAWETSAAVASDTNMFAVDWGTSVVQDSIDVKPSEFQGQVSGMGKSAAQWNKSDVESDLVNSFLDLDVSSGTSSFPIQLETLKDTSFQSVDTSISDDMLGIDWSPWKTTDSTKVQGFLGQIYGEQHSAKQSDVVISATQDDDEFGEFVGPETWQEERKVEDGKDLAFDEQPIGMAKDLLFYDNQSVSSLELPPLTLSRHGSVPSLDLKIYPSGGEKAGAGPVLDLSPQGQEKQLCEWSRCLQSCLSLLQAAVDTLGSISSDQVLEEVLGAPEGKGYLQDLHEVYGVCQRVEVSYLPLAWNDSKMDSLIASVHTAWANLQQYYTKADISVNCECQPADGSSACGVCLAVVGSVEAGSAYNTRPLEYAGRVYHAACANLWVNCVDSSLPALLPGSGGLL